MPYWPEELDQWSEFDGPISDYEEEKPTRWALKVSDECGPFSLYFSNLHAARRAFKARREADAGEYQSSIELADLKAWKPRWQRTWLEKPSKLRKRGIYVHFDGRRLMTLEELIDEDNIPF